VGRLEGLPGIESATFGVGGLPIEGARAANPVWVEDRPLPPGRLPEPLTVRVVGSGYFETLGIPLLAGRAIDRRDLESRTGVAVVSEGFARREWGEEDPLGRRIRPVPDWPWMPVVGVVADVRQDALHEPAGPAVYIPAIGAGDRFYTPPDESTYALHAAGEPAALVPALRRVVRELDPTLPLADVRTMDDVLASSMARVSFAMTLLAVAAAMGLLLGTVGIYAVTAYVTRLRTREIGVRVALGARAREIFSLVLRQGLAVSAAGIGLGLIGALVLTRALESLLFGVASLDPLTYAGVALVLGAAALAASVLPARRAAAVDPMTALRHE
jgi:predicted permease